MQTTTATGETLEPLRDEHDRDREPEGGEREVDAREPQRRQAEEEPEDAGEHPGDRDRPVLADAVVRGQDRGRVRAEGHEGAVSERDLPAVAGDDVETDDRDEVDADEREPVVEHVVLRVRDEDDEQSDPDERSRARDESRRDAGHYARLTTTRPKRPAGRTISTSSRTARATGSWSSVPMNCA